MAAKRGCGVRKHGGIYIESGSPDGGAPIEDFLIDPAIPLSELDTQGRVTPLGVHIVPGSNGSFHVIDWIGSEHYPTVWGFVEETRRLGLSRRIARTADFAKLDKRSRIYLVHAKAVLKDPAPFYAMPEWVCVTGRHPEPPVGTCAGIWPLDASDGRHGSLGENTPGDEDEPLSGVQVKPHEPGLFMVLPIERLVVIDAKQDPDEVLHALAATDRAGLPVYIEEE